MPPLPVGCLTLLGAHIARFMRRYRDQIFFGSAAGVSIYVNNLTGSIKPPRSGWAVRTL
jgi:hypothetical protein